jgi:hypothetical protein
MAEPASGKLAGGGLSSTAAFFTLFSFGAGGSFFEPPLFFDKTQQFDRVITDN